MLDNFNRANRSRTSTPRRRPVNWSQLLSAVGALTVNTNQAFCTGLRLRPRSSHVRLAPNAFRNSPSIRPTARWRRDVHLRQRDQRHRACSSRARVDRRPPRNFIRVQIRRASVLVRPQPTRAASLSTGPRSLPAVWTFANGDTLLAMALDDGTVDVYKTHAGQPTTSVGAVVIPTSGSGSWTRAPAADGSACNCPTAARVDNFVGQNVP